MSEENKIRYSAVVGHDGKAYVGINVEDSISAGANLEESESTDPIIEKGFWANTKNEKITEARIGDVVRFHVQSEGVKDGEVLTLTLKDWDGWMNVDDKLKDAPENITINNNKGYVEFTIPKKWGEDINDDVGSEIELYFDIGYEGETCELPKSTNNYLEVYSLFERLWDKYPSSELKHINKDTKEDVFSNHCAINVSESLYKNEIELNDFQGAKCYHECPTGGKEKIHAIRASELAKWLNKRPFTGCPEVSILTGEDFEESVKDKTGIIYFEDYWRRKGETEKNRSGDHIDLWNKNELRSIGLTLTYIRLNASEFSENNLDMSDLKKSARVLFWEIM